MREAVANAWNYIETGNIDALCITTNGEVRRDGACVMGAGIAKEAKERHPAFPYYIGERISDYGNQPYLYRPGAGQFFLVSFPVKHHWRDKADWHLIERSAKQLAFLANALDWEQVVLPRPGCGNGRLDWTYVRKIIEPHLDDRFTVISL